MKPKQKAFWKKEAIVNNKKTMKALIKIVIQNTTTLNQIIFCPQLQSTNTFKSAFTKKIFNSNNKSQNHTRKEILLLQILSSQIYSTTSPFR